MQSLAYRIPANYTDIYKHKWGSVKICLQACEWLTNDLEEDGHGSLHGCLWPIGFEISAEISRGECPHSTPPKKCP